MSEPRWLRRDVILAIHDQLIAVFGGESGLRDASRLDAALFRPQQAFLYGTRDLFALAASYAGAFVQGHPFIDGNKRIGFVVAATFLELNGHRLDASEADAVLLTRGLATGDNSEEDYAVWLKQACSEKPSREQGHPRPQ